MKNSPKNTRAWPDEMSLAESISTLLESDLLETKTLRSSALLFSKSRELIWVAQSLTGIKESKVLDRPKTVF